MCIHANAFCMQRMATPHAAAAHQVLTFLWGRPHTCLDQAGHRITTLFNVILSDQFKSHKQIAAFKEQRSMPRLLPDFQFREKGNGQANCGFGRCCSQRMRRVLWFNKDSFLLYIRVLRDPISVAIKRCSFHPFHLSDKFLIDEDLRV